MRILCSFYSYCKNIDVIIARVFVPWLEFTLLVPTVWYNTAQLPVQTLNAIPERAFV